MTLKPRVRLPRKSIGGLKKRFLKNTAGLLFALGMLCVILVTLLFSAYYSSAMEADLRYRAQVGTDFFSGSMGQSYQDYYQACISYANSFEEKNVIELQFIDARGRLVASSYGNWVGQAPETPEIAEAVQTRAIRPFRGKSPDTGEHILAVSSPVIYRTGEVIGVLRYVTSTRNLYARIVTVFLLSFMALLFIMLAVLFSGNYFLRSILVPVQNITEKAKRISGGSYGIQIPKAHNDEIGELVDAINEMSLQISQNEKIQRDFISSLSHELRTPLTSITGWSETLLTCENLDQETARGMKIISKEAQRLTEMVVELLDFTRIQDGRMTLNIRPSDLRGEFEDTVFMYSSRLSQEGITLEYLENDDDIPEIPCDPERMRQVFLNILDNAAKHGAEGRRIEASIHREPKFVSVKIRDFGPGIPEDEIPLVKKKFYKGSSKARGTGIGLAVCDEIVQMHSGQLLLENAPGGGTLVTVRLPISQ